MGIDRARDVRDLEVGSQKRTKSWWKLGSCARVQEDEQPNLDLILVKAKVVCSDGAMVLEWQMMCTSDCCALRVV